MNTKIFLASFIVAVVLSLLAFFINIEAIFPSLLAYFLIALISGSLTTFWVIRPPSEPKAKKPKHAKTPRKSKLGPKETGSVKWFSASKGYGFVTRESGEDIFVHFRSIEGKGHRVLQQGQKVDFVVTNGDKGLQAEEVNLIK